MGRTLKGGALRALLSQRRPRSQKRIKFTVNAVPHEVPSIYYLP